MRRMRRRVKGPRGLGMVELLLVVTIIALMYWLTPNYLSGLERARRTRAELELTRVAEQLYGRDVEDHGYLGDVGAMPVTVLNLAVPSGVGSARRLGDIPYGWHGPYGPSNPAEYRDPWGGDWVLDLVTGQLRAPGMDGVMGTSDDVVAPAYPRVVNGVFGQLGVEVIDTRTGLQLDATQVTVTVEGADPAAPGTLRTVGGTFQPLGWFDFLDLAPSLHLVRAQGVAGTRWEDLRGLARVRISPGATSVIQLRMDHTGT